LKILSFACALTIATSALAEQPVIRSQSDLPPARFKLDAKPSLAFSDAAFLKVTVPALKSEAEHILSGYRIDDPAIAQQLRNGLAAIAILEHRPADADRLIAEQRRAENKPQLQKIGGLLLELAAAGIAAPPGQGCSAADKLLGARLAAAPAEIVRDEVIRRYSDVQTASIAYYAGAGVYMIDDQAQAVGSIDVLDGLYMARWRVIAERIPLCREQLGATFRAWLARPENRPTDIWPAREPKSSTFANAKPVVVAVWESGFDLSLFPGQLAMDPAEPFDGVDNDGNGVIDDIHGPTYDTHLRPTAAVLPPLSQFLAARLGLQMAIEKGQLDLNYGDDTADARFFAARGRDASVAEQSEDLIGSSEFIAHTHGTWVASVIADGAPFVRLYDLVAYPEGADPKPIAITEDDARSWAALMPRLGERLRGAGVRVVNMSWRFNVDIIRGRLLEGGAETDPARATARAKAIYAILKPALDTMIRQCPDILFVASAGNSDQSQEIQAAIPQIFDAPNLLVVGAAGANGRATAFTSYGSTVRLYAKGEAVSVRAPGGMTMKSSGTSFSGPMVARAAASMLAVKPQLTPAQLIHGLLATATANEDRLALLHPAQAVSWAAAQP
jgi:hypothetical protein